MVIRPSSDIRNNYPEISRFCKENKEPVFLTSNGNGDIVVLSIDEYTKLKKTVEEQAKLINELEHDLDITEKLMNAHESIIEANTISNEDAFASIRKKLAELQEGKR